MLFSASIIDSLELDDSLYSQSKLISYNNDLYYAEFMYLHIYFQYPSFELLKLGTVQCSSMCFQLLPWYPKHSNEFLNSCAINE